MHGEYAPARAPLKNSRYSFKSLQTFFRGYDEVGTKKWKIMRSILREDLFFLENTLILGRKYGNMRSN